MVEPAFPVEEVRRVARLARLALAPDEEAALARDLASIAAAFSELSAHAAALPFAEDAPPGALRADEAAPAPDAQVAAILAAAPRVDAASRLVRVPRGSAE